VQQFSFTDIFHEPLKTAKKDNKKFKSTERKK